MTETIDTQQVIIQGIKDLPKQYLDEVASFVVFLRQKTIKSYDFKGDLSILNEQQINHLEEEFKDFEKQFPKE